MDISIKGALASSSESSDNHQSLIEGRVHPRQPMQRGRCTIGDPGCAGLKESFQDCGVPFVEGSVDVPGGLIGIRTSGQESFDLI